VYYIAVSGPLIVAVLLVVAGLMFAEALVEVAGHQTVGAKAGGAVLLHVGILVEFADVQSVEVSGILVAGDPIEVAGHQAVGAKAGGAVLLAVRVQVEVGDIRSVEVYDILIVGAVCGVAGFLFAEALVEVAGHQTVGAKAGGAVPLAVRVLVEVGDIRSVVVSCILIVGTFQDSSWDHWFVEILLH